MEPEPHGTDQSQDDLRRRLELLERENARLRRQIEPLLGPDNPCFDRQAFLRAMRFYMLVVALPIAVFATVAPQVMTLGLVPRIQLGSVALIDMAGIGTNHPGIGFGLIAFGGLGLGVVALGGLAVGIIALGGGAIGLVAFGGGSLGLIAIGGGAVGYIAIGGNAIGRYALGGNARGKAVFAINRQDPEAVDLFTRWLPRFKAAVTTPLPVVPLEKQQ